MFAQSGDAVRLVGSAVSGVAVGERVFAALGKVSGMFDGMGGHIQPSVCPIGQIWRLPPGADPDDYCGLVLAQVGYNCGMRPTVQTGDRAFVIGDGLVGQWAAQTLLHRGAELAVLGRHNGRLSLLPEGVHRVNAREEEELSDILRTFSKVAIVVDTVGDMDTFWQIEPAMTRDSHLVSAGFLGEKGLVDIQRLRGREMTLHTPSGWTASRMDATIEAIDAGWLRTSPLITHRFPAMEAAKAWAFIQANKSACLGVVLEW